MDGFEFNKIAGGVLAAALVILGSKIFVSEVMVSHSPEKPGIVIAAAEPDAGKPAAGGEAKPAVSFVNLVKGGDVTAGQKVTKKCAACHKFNEGGKNGIGPALHGIVGKKIAAKDGFKYSKALQGKEGVWNWESLSAFLAAPKKWAKGTKMAFVGVKKDKDRANLIAYLRSISPSAPALPE